MYFYYGNRREQLQVTVRTTEFFLKNLVLDGYLDEEIKEEYFEVDCLDTDRINELEDIISDAVIDRVQDEVERTEDEILEDGDDEINFMEYTDIQKFETAIIFDPILKDHIDTQYVNQNRSKFCFC